MSNPDPLEVYAEKRFRRTSLALLRIVVGLVLGFVAGLRGGDLCWLAPLIYVTIYIATIYVGPWTRSLEPRDNYTAGILSSPAALLLGYFLGSVA